MHSSVENVPTDHSQVSPSANRSYAAGNEERAQVLWHVSRADGPPVIARLTQSDGYHELQVTYGTVARQRSTFTSPIGAVQHAERLLEHLELSGFRRERRDRRRSA